MNKYTYKYVEDGEWFGGRFSTAAAARGHALLRADSPRSFTIYIGEADGCIKNVEIVHEDASPRFKGCNIRIQETPDKRLVKCPNCQHIFVEQYLYQGCTALNNGALTNFCPDCGTKIKEVI